MSEEHYKLIGNELIISDTAFFEEFLHMFLEGGEEDKPFCLEYYPTYLGDGCYRIVAWGGDICREELLYEKITPKLENYGYALGNDLILRPTGLQNPSGK